jgi:hypothetical protein
MVEVQILSWRHDFQFCIAMVWDRLLGYYWDCLIVGLFFNMGPTTCVAMMAQHTLNFWSWRGNSKVSLILTHPLQWSQSFMSEKLTLGQEHCHVLPSETSYKNAFFCHNHLLQLLEPVLFYKAKHRTLTVKSSFTQSKAFLFHITIVYKNLYFTTSIFNCKWEHKTENLMRPKT